LAFFSPNLSRLYSLATFGLLTLIVVSAFQRASAQPIIHLEGLSDQKTFIVKIEWTSAEIGNENQFNVTFYDSDTKTLIEDVRYDFEILGSAGNPLMVVNDTGNPIQRVTFAQNGAYIVEIGNIEGLGEGLKIPIQVTPEFGIDETLPLTILIAVPPALKLAKIYLD
jgi:hypothetical protein